VVVICVLVFGFDGMSSPTLYRNAVSSNLHYFVAGHKIYYEVRGAVYGEQLKVTVA